MLENLSSAAVSPNVVPLDVVTVPLSGAAGDLQSNT